MTTFVLIDYENVQPTDLALLRGGDFKVRLFLGAHRGIRSADEAPQVKGRRRPALSWHRKHPLGEARTLRRW
jgi:hypothetical protein